MIARPTRSIVTAARIALLTAGLALGSLASAIPSVAAVSQSGMSVGLFTPVAASTPVFDAGSATVHYRADGLGASNEAHRLGLDDRTSLSLSGTFKVVSVQGPDGVSVRLNSATLTEARPEDGMSAMVALEFAVTVPSTAQGSTPIEVTLENTRTGQRTVVGLAAVVD